MGVFVPMTDGAQVQLLYSLGGKIVSNRLWFFTDVGPIDSVALQGLVDGVFDWHTTYILPSLSQDLLLGTVIGETWDATPPALTALNITGATGGVTEESYSANVAAVVRFRWPINHNRLKQNKHYIPGLPDSAVTLNTVDPAFQDVLWNAYVVLIDAVRLFTPGFFWWWHVNSAFSGGAPRSEQFSRQCIGPVAANKIILGQRRKRVPA